MLTLLNTFATLCELHAPLVGASVHAPVRVLSPESCVMHSAYFASKSNSCDHLMRELEGQTLVNCSNPPCRTLKQSIIEQGFKTCWRTNFFPSLRSPFLASRASS